MLEAEGAELAGGLNEGGGGKGSRREQGEPLCHLLQRGHLGDLGKRSSSALEKLSLRCQMESHVETSSSQSVVGAWSSEERQTAPVYRSSATDGMQSLGIQRGEGPGPEKVQLQTRKSLTAHLEERECPAEGRVVQARRWRDPEGGGLMLLVRLYLTSFLPCPRTGRPTFGLLACGERAWQGKA